MTCSKNPSTLEILPNELLLIICTHLTGRELSHSLCPLNRRFRIIGDSLPGLLLSVTEHECRIPPWLALPRIIRLNIDRVKDIDLRHFRAVRSIKWIAPSNTQLRQLYTSNCLPQLQHLFVYDTPDTLTTGEFHQTIFSDGFPLLRKCKLNWIDLTYLWTFSPTLRSISIDDVTESLVFERILTACPNLNRLDLHVRPGTNLLSTSAFQHVKLKKLFLTGNSLHKSVAQILSHVPGLIHLNVKWKIRERAPVYFQYLSNSFNRFLLFLIRFECEFLCNGRCEDSVGLKDILEQLHPCFMHRLRLTKLDYGRIRISTK